MHGLGFSFSLDSHALLVPWSPSFHFSLSTSILSKTYASLGECYHYSKVDLSTLVELTLLRILTLIYPQLDLNPIKLIINITKLGVQSQSFNVKLRISC